MTWGTHCPQCGREDCRWTRGTTCDGLIRPRADRWDRWRGPLSLVATIAFLVAAVAVAFITTAAAGYGGRGHLHIHNIYFGPWLDPGGQVTKILKVPPGDFDAAEDAKWSEYCQPKIKRDAFGVKRYVYAHPGCEYGRSSD